MHCSASCDRGKQGARVRPGRGARVSSSGGACPVVRRRRHGRRRRRGREGRVGKGARRRRGRGRRRGRHERLGVHEAAVDKGEPGRALEHVLHDAAAARVCVANALVDCGHAAANLIARGERLEGVAALKGGHKKLVVFDRAVGRGGVVEGLAEHKLRELGERDDRREVVLVLRAVDAAARGQALDGGLLAEHLVLAAGREVVAKLVHPASGVGEDLVLETPARDEEELARRVPERAGGQQVVVVGRVVREPARLGLAALVAAPARSSSAPRMDERAARKIAGVGSRWGFYMW